MHIVETEKATGCQTDVSPNISQKSSDHGYKKPAKLDKSRLIQPVEALRLLSIRHRRSGQRLECYCPFHKNGAESSPSLMVNVRDGYFRCFTCGVKGGDVIALYRIATGCSFSEAVAAMEASHD